MGRGQTSRGTHVRRAAAVCGLTLALLLALGEVGLRVSGYRERVVAESVNRTNRRWMTLMRGGMFESVPDPVRRYAMKPGASVQVDDWTFRADEHRARGPSFPTAKPAGEKRLLCLGDSFAFGMWCAEERTLVGHLAAMANAAEEAAGSGVTWRPVNLGVPGYHTGQQLRALEQDGLALEPDVVVVYFNSNDITREGFFYDDELGALRGDHLPLPVGLRRALWHSHLYGWVVQQLNRHWGALDGGRDPRQPWSPLREDNRRATRDALARIAQLCSERGIGLFVVNQPLMTWSSDARDPNWSMLPVNAWADATLAELGIANVNLLPFQQGFADNVARRDASGALAPNDFYPMQYFADEEVQRYLAAYQEQQAALARGEDAPAPELELPAEPDYHLTGDGYAHMARICYPRLREAGLLP